jgi:hypothetical protein
VTAVTLLMLVALISPYLWLVALLKRLTLPAADSAGLDTESDFSARFHPRPLLRARLRSRHRRSGRHSSRIERALSSSWL